jgi:hypothetical protein
MICAAANDTVPEPVLRVFFRGEVLLFQSRAKLAITRDLPF